MKEISGELNMEYKLTLRPYESVLQLFIDGEVVGSIGITNPHLLEWIQDEARNSITFKKYEPKLDVNS